MASSDSDSLSEHRTSELGNPPSSSPRSTPRPSRRPRVLSSPPHRSAPSPKRRRRHQALAEDLLGVRSDDLDSITSSPQTPSSPPSPPLQEDDGLYSVEEFQEIVNRIKRFGSVRKLLRTAMWRGNEHYGVMRHLKALLLEKDNPFVTANNYELVDTLLDTHGWRPVKKVIRRELLRYGEKVVQQFKVPDYMDEQLNLNEQLEFLGDEQRCRIHAPTLFDLLAACAEPLRHDSPRSKPPWPALTVMAAQLTYMAAPRRFNRLAVSLGMVLSYYHLTKQGLETLNALGITASYKTINGKTKQLQDTHAKTLKLMCSRMNRQVVWDNLNRVNNVQETRAGDEKEQMNITTGLVKLCRSIPEHGLLQSMLDWTRDLTTEDILPVQRSAIVARRRLERELWLFYIFSAIQTCFPNILSDCKKNDRYRTDLTFPTTLPNRGRPEEHGPDWSIPLGPLMFDESTNQGTDNIFVDIYEKQFAVNEEDTQFDQRFFLHVGDALTTMRIWTWKADKSPDPSPYGGGQWVLPLFGLWHLRYNYAKMIIAEHWGGHNDDLGCLYQVWHSTYTNRHCDRKIFQVIDNLIMQSFQSRFVALFLCYLREHPNTAQFAFEDDGRVIPNRISVAQWWSLQKIGLLNDVVNWIYSQTGLLANSSRTDPERAQEHDEEWTNHINFIHNVFPYVLLADAIRYCDVGLMRLAMQLTLLMFTGNSNKWLYQRELCYFNWLINSPAADKELQEILVKESLINRQGKSDSYYPMDLANEMLNLLITKAKALRSTSELKVRQLVDRYTRTAHFLTELAAAFDRVVEIHQTRYHTKKALDDHIWLLAGNLWVKDHTGNSSITYAAGRGTRGHTNLWYTKGQLQLNNIVMKFNQVKNKALISGDLETAEDAEQQLENMELIQENFRHRERIALAIRLKEAPISSNREGPAQPVNPTPQGIATSETAEMDHPGQTSQNDEVNVSSNEESSSLFSDDASERSSLTSEQANLLRWLGQDPGEVELEEKERHPEHEDSEVENVEDEEDNSNQSGLLTEQQEEMAIASGQYFE